MKKQIIKVKQISWFDDRAYKIRFENEQKLEIDEFLPSVTTKLKVKPKPWLLKYYADLGYKEARMRLYEAGERGSRIHWAWEAFVNGGVVIYDPIKAPIYNDEEIAEIKGQFAHSFVLREQGEMWDFLKLKEFYTRINPNFKLCEQTVFDLDHKDAGTLDNIFGIKAGEYEINGAKIIKLEDGLYIFDAKTGASVGDEACMQVSAYYKCLLYMLKNKMIELPDQLIKGAIIGHTQAVTRKGIIGFGTKVLNVEEMEEYYRRFRNLAKVWEDENPNFSPIIRELPGYVAL